MYSKIRSKVLNESLVTFLHNEQPTLTNELNLYLQVENLLFSQFCCSTTQRIIKQNIRKGIKFNIIFNFGLRDLCKRTKKWIHLFHQQPNENIKLFFSLTKNVSKSVNLKSN